MPISDTTPARKLVIRRGTIRYIVDEAKYDTVQIYDEATRRTDTYKGLGFEVVSAIEDGNEVPYVKREHVAAVPGREDVAAEQVAQLQAADQPVPAALAKAAGITPESKDDDEKAEPSPKARKS